MNASNELLTLAVQLATRESRPAAASALAALFGGVELLVFVRDAEVGRLLTAPGMRQTLRNGRAWQAFLAQCVTDGYHAGELPYVSNHELVPVAGAAASAETVVVVVGTKEIRPELAAFRNLLPLLGIAIRGEHLASVSQDQLKIADAAAVRAAELAKALDEARARVQHANEELRRQAIELENANDSLQTHALELEMQTVELETQIAARNAAHEELEAARANAERANRAKSDFLTTMSHELRTPLNAISGYVQLIQLGIHGPVTAEQHESLDRINRSQQHLLRLINEILSLARIEAGRVDYEIVDVSIADAIHDLMPLIEPQLTAKQLTFEVDIPPRPIAVRADREKLGQILINLMSNAIKFTDAGGTIAIAGGESATVEEMGYISVRDTGRGVPADKLKTIFDPFTQVDTGLTRNSEGTGLGLSISRDLAKGMSGDLTLASELGRGSVFTVLLPKSAIEALTVQHPTNSMKSAE